MTDAERRRLYSLIRVIKLFRREEPEAMVAWLEMLLHIAVEEGQSLRELTEKVDQSQSSASRTVAALGEYHRLGKPGMRLIDNLVAPEERRRKKHILTPKGRKFIRDILREMEA